MRFAGRITILILATLFLCHIVAVAAAAPAPQGDAQPQVSPAKVKTVKVKRPKKSSRPKKTIQPKPLISKTTKAKAESITSQVSDVLPERLESEIKQYFGLRYRIGGTGQNGIDCSGLVQKVYSDVFDINLPRSSWEQSRLEKMESVANNQIETGDLLFFGPRRKHVNHVGIYLASGYFLHAASSEGVTISRLDDNYWKSRWMLSKRVKGLQIGYEAEADPFEGAFTEFALGSAFSGDTEAIGYLEGGLKFNDWPEFRLTGFYSRALAETMQISGAGGSLPLQPVPYYLDEGVSGFRMAAVFAPLPWEGFRLVPSVTQISVRNGNTGRKEDNQALGLETWVSLPASRIAVHMGAHAQNREDIFARQLNSAPDWQTLDFSFGLHYRLSEAFNISLTGTHAYRDAFDDDELQEVEDRFIEDVAFRMNFRF